MTNSAPNPGDTPGTLLDGMRNGTWLDAQTFPPLQWAVPGLIAEGMGLLVGPPKLGKSWFALGVGLAVAQGGYALGKIRVEQRPVLYAALHAALRAKTTLSRLRAAAARHAPVSRA